MQLTKLPVRVRVDSGIPRVEKRRRPELRFWRSQKRVLAGLGAGLAASLAWIGIRRRSR